MAYQPFLIAPYASGLDQDQEVWLQPRDAFSEFENANIKHGYVQKRNGFVLLGDMVHGREITAATNANPAVFTVTSIANLANDQSVSIHYLAGGTWSTLNGAKYTIKNLGATTFTLEDSTGTAVSGVPLGAYDVVLTGRLGIFPGNRMMGIFRYIDSTGGRVTLISDTKRVAVYNPTFQLFEPLDLYDPAGAGTTYPDSDCWSSLDTDYIWHANWQHAGAINRVYFTNGKSVAGAAPGTDGIWFYDATSNRIELFRPVINGTTTINGCKLIFAMKQRLVLHHTFEGANTFPQKARWCQVQSPSGADSWDDNVAGKGGFVEAPTGDQIISGRDLQDMLISQFTDSIWTFQPVSDPALPFRWDKLNNLRATDSRMGTAGFDRYVMAVGQRGITATDGGDTQRVDERVQDFTTDNVNQDQFEKVIAERDFSERKTWILYPNENNDDCENALILDEESKSWSTYKFARTSGSAAVVDMNILGYGTAAKDYSASDFTAANNLDIDASQADADATALSYSWSQNSELFLGGDRTGRVFIMEQGNSDYGKEISFSIKSAGWNPFQEQGVEAQLGYVDLYVDSDMDTNLEVHFFKDDNEFAYLETGMDLLPNLDVMADVTLITPNPDPTTGFTIYSPHHGVAVNKLFYIYGVDGAYFYNDFQWQANAVTENTISITNDITPFGKAITAITQAATGVVTAADHGRNNGEVVTLLNVGGMIEVNGLEFTVANATTDTFELQGVDTTGSTLYTAGGYVLLAYVEGGTINKNQFYRTKTWKRVYAGGIGYLHQMKLFSNGNFKPLRLHAFKPWFRPRGRRTLG